MTQHTSSFKKDSLFENELKSDDLKTGNKFGRGIEFREGVPIQLLQYREKSENENFGQIVLNPEALNILQTINEPLAIISVVGSYRRGKSWFANVLHGRHNGFELGAEVEGCTRGIYMWSPPFKFASKQYDGKTIRVIVLDSEGIDDPRQDYNWATKLFILCLTISSSFIYNINGIFRRDDIGKLCLMTDLSNYIQKPKEGDFLPRLVILLRDFDLKTPDNFKDYFMKRLENVNPETANAISRFFQDFDVYGLSHPKCKTNMLQHMEEAKTDELDEDFVKKVVGAVKEIYSQLPLKYMGSSTMKGEAFVKFLQNIIEHMNSIETSICLTIPSEYKSVIEFVSKKEISEAIGRYKESMNILMNEKGKLPMLWEEFERMHDKCISEVNILFFEKIIGSATQILCFAKELNEEISKFKNEFKGRNSEELTKNSEIIVRGIWASYEKTKPNLFKSPEEFEGALESLKSDYDKSKKESPEATKVIDLFIQSKYQSLNHYISELGGIRDKFKKVMTNEVYEKLKSQKLAHEEEIKALERDREALKREREEFDKNAKMKMLELKTNIEQQKNSQEEMQRRLDEERKLFIEQFDKNFEEKLAEKDKKIQELEDKAKKLEFKISKMKSRRVKCVIA